MHTDTNTHIHTSSGSYVPGIVLSNGDCAEWGVQNQAYKGTFPVTAKLPVSRSLGLLVSRSPDLPVSWSPCPLSMLACVLSSNSSTISCESWKGENQACRFRMPTVHCGGDAWFRQRDPCFLWTIQLWKCKVTHFSCGEDFHPNWQNSSLEPFESEV